MVSFNPELIWIYIIELFFLILNSECHIVSGGANSRVVTMKYGSLRGLVIKPDNEHLDQVEAFLGIPYAQAPVGSLRFMPPMAISPWKGIRMSGKYAPVCPQKLPDISNTTEALNHFTRGRLLSLQRILPYLQNQSEDCLHLNIYVPKTTGK